MHNRILAGWKFAAISFGLILGGCGDGIPTPKTHLVKGTVTLDGQPLSDGSVQFKTISTGAIDALPVKDGAFSGSAQAGEKRVEIYAYRMVTPKVDMPGFTPEPTRENFLPAKFNTQTALKATIKPDDTNAFAFEVTSK